MTRTDTGWVTRLTHPPHGMGTGYVLLHARAVDDAGNSVDQTIIHAYGLSPVIG